jgi:hypothetical protein
VFSDAISSIKATSGGEQARLIDIYVAGSADISKTEADEIFRKLASNYGLAGPIFVSFVLKNKALVIETLHQMQRKIDETLNLDKSDRFHSGTLACSFTGAYFARQIGLIDIEIAPVYQYMLKELAGVKISNKASVSHGDSLAAEILGRYINDNLANALIIESPKNGLPAAPIEAPRNALKLRYEPDRKELWIPAHELRSYLVEHQVDVRQTLKGLVSMKMLKNDGKAIAKRIAAGSIGSMSVPSVRSYCFDSDAVGVANAIETS